jgi:PPOX class probable F420-dependent enzyme
VSTTRSTESQGVGTDHEYFAPLREAKAALLTTFRRDGTPVSTPVHVVVEGDTAVFRTWEPSGKWKRLRHDPRVLVAPSTTFGRPTGRALGATVELLEGDEDRAAARELVHEHPISHRIIPLVHRLRGWRTHHYRLRPAATRSCS